MNISGGETGERRPGRKWGGGVREVGVEGVKGIPKVVRRGRSGEMYATLRNISQ